MTAADLVSDGARLRRGAIVTLLAPIAETLAIVHGLGVAHGSVRPEHIIVSREGKPSLTGWQAATSVSSGGDARDDSARRRGRPAARRSARVPRGSRRNSRSADARSDDVDALLALVRELAREAEIDVDRIDGAVRDTVSRTTVARESVARTGSEGNGRTGSDAGAAAAALAEALYDVAVPEPIGIPGDARGDDHVAGIVGIGSIVDGRGAPTRSGRGGDPSPARRGLVSTLRRRPLIVAATLVTSAAAAAVAVLP